MADSLNDYSSSSVNWRNTLRQNHSRTYIIIGLFFLIYLSIGLLVDMLVVADLYPRATIPQITHSLITFQIFPVATATMLVIAAISLLVSYTFYDKLMLLGTNYHEITPTTAQNTQEQQLYNVVEEMKIAASLRYMPRVFIIDADYMNAFASGYSEKSAMVAITRGLMEKLDRDELQAVMAHELSHIRHMDIKLTLTASLLANISIMVLDIVFRGIIYSSHRRSDSKSSNKIAVIIIILRFVLPIVTLLLLLYLSRTREVMADAGAVELTRSNHPLAKALIKIQGDYRNNAAQYNQLFADTQHEQVRRASYLYDPSDVGVNRLTSINDIFSTHPSLEARLALLGYKKRQ